ncbi:MAG: outer membrane lipoprotein-sorting protein [Chthonomonas sp.]|nr:outer membrane lipoprotein-sorting protein [Chthonomonas sp.]
MISTIALVALATPLVAPTIDDYIPKFRDAAFTMKVGQANFAELRKINKDFADSYRFKTTDVKMKEPFKLRVEGKLDGSSIMYIINGKNKLVKVPRSKISFRDNVANSPGKIQTPLDFGLITASIFDDFYRASFVRNDRATGDVVFDLTYEPRFKDNTRQRVFIEPTTKLLTKREWYNRKGDLMAIFTYGGAAKDSGSGVYFPTTLTVRNADNKVAGTATYTDLKVNDGLSESLFELK